MAQYRVLVRDVLPSARNINDEIDISSKAEADGYLEKGFIEAIKPSKPVRKSARKTAKK